MRDSGAESDPLASGHPSNAQRAGARFGARGADLTPQPPPRSPAAREPDDRLEWRPAAGAGPLIGGILIVVSLAVVLLAWWQFRGVGGPSKGVWLVVGVGALFGAAYSAYLLHGLGTLRYIFTADALLVRWMREEHVIPYDEMLDVVYQPRDAIHLAARERFWPGYYVSVVQRPEGVWRSWATESPHRRVRIVTTQGIAAISPRRAIRFLDELDRRRARRVPPQRAQPPTPSRAVAGRPITRSEPEALPNVGVPPRRPLPALNRPVVEDIYRALFRERLLGDPVASVLIAIGVALPLLMAGYLFSQYEGVPRDVPLHWDAHGQLDRIGARRDLWLLPLTAALILVANTLLATLASAFDRFAARLLTAATPIAQVAAVIALVRLMY